MFMFQHDTSRELLRETQIRINSEIARFVTHQLPFKTFMVISQSPSRLTQSAPYAA